MSLKEHASLQAFFAQDIKEILSIQNTALHFPLKSHLPKMLLRWDKLQNK